eukprot:299957-Prymnesium_polylepis.1
MAAGWAGFGPLCAAVAGGSDRHAKTRVAPGLPRALVAGCVWAPPEHVCVDPCAPSCGGNVASSRAKCSHAQNSGVF